VIRAFLVFFIFSLLAACSSGGGGGGKGSGEEVSTASTSGTVVLPSGFTLQPASLSVASAMGTAAVGSNGGYTVTEPAGGGAATVMLLDANGKVVMLGHVDTGNPTFNEISPHSTAVEMLFLATGAFSLPKDEWPNIYSILAAAPETTTLAGVIATRMAVNPTAVGDMDADIIAATDAAASSLMTAPSTQSSAAAASQSAVALQSVKTQAALQLATAAQATADDTGNLDVQTSASTLTPNPGFGLVVSPSNDHLGIVITNTSRINRYYYVFRSGWIPSTGTVTQDPEAITPWERVGEGLLPSVTGATGVTSSLYDCFMKKTWTPVDTPTIKLPIDNDPRRSGALANTYKVYIIGPGMNDVDITEIKNNYPGAADLVQHSYDEMVVYQALKEFMWPVISKILPLSSEKTIFKDYATDKLSIDSFLKTLTNFGIPLQQQLIAEPLDPWKPVSALFKASLGPAQDGLKKAILTLGENLAGKQYISEGAGKTWQKYTGTLFSCLKIVDGILTGSDIFAYGAMIEASNKYNVYDARALTPTFKLDPVIGVISSPTQSATFFVKTTGYLPKNLTYEWGPSKYGQFTTPGCGLTGNPVTCKGSQTALYTLKGSSFPAENTDSFTVKVYDSKGVLRAELSGLVNFTNVDLKPMTPFVQTGQHKTFTVSLTNATVPAGTNVTWSLNGCGTIVTGGLNGNSCSVTSNSLTVDYLAPDTPQTDTLNVQLIDSANRSLGSSSTKIYVGTGVSIAPVSPTLKFGAEQEFTVSGDNGFELPPTATFKWILTGNGSLSATTTTVPRVTYTAPASSNSDTLQVQVIYQDQVIATSTPMTINVGKIVTWKGSSYTMTDPDGLKIEDWSDMTMLENYVDDTHVFFTGTSTDSHNNQYTLTLGSRAAPLALSSSQDGATSSIVVPNGCTIVNNTHGCTAVTPPTTLTQGASQLLFPATSYTWSGCSGLQTIASAFSLTKQ